MRAALVINAFIFALNSSGRVLPVVANNGSLENEYTYVFPTLGNLNDTDLDRFQMRDCYGFKLEETTIDLLQEAMNGGRLTVQQIVSCYQQRILQTDGYIKFVFSERASMVDAGVVFMQ